MVKRYPYGKHCVLTLLLMSALQFSACVSAAGWDFQWQPLAAVNEMPLLPVTAEVVQNVQATTALVLPFDVQVHTLYVQSGQQVQSGEPLLKLSGPLVLNFAERLEIAQHHATAAALRLRDNQSRYATGDILRETWLEWQHQAHQTALDYAALQQQQHLLQQWQASFSQDGVTLLAPGSGVVVLPAELRSGVTVPSGSELMALQLNGQTVLEFRLPVAQQADLIRTAGCTLQVSWRSNVVEQQFRRYRSSAVPSDCPLLTGQRLSVQPWRRLSGYKLPRQAIVQDGTGDAVITGPADPALLAVRVLGQSGDWVYVQGELGGKQAATADVAALKGQLQGMGGAE